MAVVAMQGEELMNMVSGKQLLEVKQRYLDLLEEGGYEYKRRGNWILWGVRPRNKGKGLPSCATRAI
jgi:hypothetical protein